MAIRLTCTDNVGNNQEVCFDDLPAVIGRGQEADVQILDQFASRMHCELSLIGGVLQVRDLDSGNGTLVNGDLVNESCVNPGDHLTIGISTFRVSYSKRVLQRAGFVFDEEDERGGSAVALGA